MMEAKVRGRHRPVPSLRIHDTVIVGQGQQTGAAEDMASDAGDCRVGEIENGS